MRRLCLAAGRLFLALILPSTVMAEEPARVAIPSPAKQAELEQRVRSVFKTEYADRTTNGRVNLARRLLKEAGSNKNDTDTHFVLLREARDRATDAGNLPLALDCIDAINESFLIDALAMKGDVVTRAGPRANSQGDYQDVVSACMEVMDDAVASDRYDVAMKVTSLADTAASKIKSMTIVNEVDSRVKEIRQMSAEYNRASSAMNLLKKDPNNAAANLAVGRYTAFFKSNWEEGLPLLARGSDAALKAVAAQDLQNPTEAPREFAVGSAWWDLGEKYSDLIRTRMRERAGYWYRQAYPNLAGLDKTQAEKRLDEIGLKGSSLAASQPAGAKLEPGLVGEFYSDLFFRNLVIRRVDPTIFFEWGRGRPDEHVGGGRFSIRWSGILMVPRPGVSSIGVDVDDCVHVFIDEQAIIRVERPTRLFKTTKLSPGPHTIRVEYWNNRGAGRMKLFWSLAPTAGNPPAIPADALFHAPTAGKTQYPAF